MFLPHVAQQFRSRCNEVQIGLVDDPTQAVRHADELVALRRDRSFFQRLLSL